MGLLNLSNNWLNEQMEAAAGVSITYSRGGNSATITAWVGRTMFRADDRSTGDSRITFSERDYLIPAASVVLGGEATTPARGDRITEIIDGTTYVYEIIPYVGEPEWRWSDVARTRYRVHCKLVVNPT